MVLRAIIAVSEAAVFWKRPGRRSEDEGFRCGASSDTRTTLERASCSYIDGRTGRGRITDGRPE